LGVRARRFSVKEGIFLGTVPIFVSTKMGLSLLPQTMQDVFHLTQKFLQALFLIKSKRIIRRLWQLPVRNAAPSWMRRCSYLNTEFAAHAAPRFVIRARICAAATSKMIGPAYANAKTPGASSRTVDSSDNKSRVRRLAASRRRARFPQ
jgi:hypothetical protein